MDQSLRKIKVRSSSEERIVIAFEKMTLESVLLIEHLPTNLFQGYLADINIFNDHLIPIPLNTIIQEISLDKEIILQCIRNIDFRNVLPQRIDYEKVKNPVTILRSFNFSGEECAEKIYEINDISAQKLVSEKVVEFMGSQSTANKVIVGISGGGDSNALVKSLKAFSDKGVPKEYICFTLVFEPFWPKGAAKRAEDLCKEYNIKHHIYDESGMENFLEMKGKMKNFLEEFKKVFGINTHNFFATYIISKIARKICSLYKTNEYCLGFNREDILAELLFSLMNGRKPLAYPVRTFGDIKLLMPLWVLPKKILDACYPKYSRSNYREREQGDEKTTRQRSLIFYLGHAVDDIYDNFGLSLMSGIQKLFTNSWPNLRSIEEADLYVLPDAEPEKIEAVKTLLAKYF